jgi:methyl-accepting chemotaxis protein
MNNDHFNIILVEDDADDAELILLQLEKVELPVRSYHVKGFNEFEALLETIDADLIISDYNLGNNTGLDILQCSIKSKKYIPFVILSGFIGEEKAVEIIKEGADDYIMKDNLVRLVPTVERILSKLDEQRRDQIWKNIFESVIVSSSIGAILINNDLKIVMVSQFICDLSGYSEDELVGKPKSFLYLNIPGENYHAEIKKTENTGEGKYTHEWLMKTKDQSLREVQSTVTPISINGEESKNLISFVTDVTQKNKEDRLRRQAESISGVGGWEYHVINDTISHTKKALEIYGLKQSQVINKRVDYFLSFYDEPSRKKLSFFISDAIKNQKSYRGEFELTDFGGVKKVVELSGVPVSEKGKVILLYGTFEDITKEKEQQKELKKLSLVAEKTQNAVIITNSDNKIEWVNEAFTSITGYAKKEILDLDPGDLLQGPETDPEVVKRMSEAVRKQQPFKEEIINYTKSGEPYWIKISSMPIFDEKGNLKQYFSIQEDITERKKTTLELEETEKNFVKL